MTKYISILRGINVGGKRKILMADLRELYQSLGFENVITYIQSGNVIFESKKKNTNSTFTKKIKEAVFEKYGFDVPVIIRSVEEIKSIVENHPFEKKEGAQVENLCLTFLSEIPSDENLEKINTYDYAPDLFQIIEDNVFLFIQGKYHQSKLTNNFFEKKLKVSATTRNWKTVNKLLELSTN
ncbi:MAG: DUF1697 domain-containing protein [Saprospiraceae bacterium]